MAEKNIASRIVHKHDTAENWSKATGFIPKQGELIVYDADNDYPYERFKIGDGATVVSSLPFAAEVVRTTLEDILPETKTNGYAYFCTDTGNLYVDHATGELFHKDHLIDPAGQNSFITIDGIEYYRYHASEQNFEYIMPNPQPGSVTITARLVNQYNAGNETRLVVHYSDGSTEYMWAMKDYAVTHTTNASKTFTKLTGNYDIENWVLLDLSVMSIKNIDNAVVRSKVSAEYADKLRYEQDGETVEIDASEVLHGIVPVTSGGTGADNAVTALANLGIYIGDTEPTDENIRIWINTAEEGTGVVPVLPRITTVDLPASGWTGSANPYSQVVTVNGVTANSKLDLQPTAQQIVALQNEDIALMAENNAGTVTFYALGGKPTSDYTMQVLLTEVSYV